MNATTEARMNQASESMLVVEGIVDFAVVAVAGAGHYDIHDGGTERLLNCLLETRYSRPMCLEPLIDAVAAADHEAWHLCQDDWCGDDDEVDEGGSEEDYVLGAGFDGIDRDSGGETLLYHLALRSIYGIALQVSAPVRRYHKSDMEGYTFSWGYTRGAWVYGNTYEEAWAEAVKWSEERVAGEKAAALRESDDE